MSRQEVPVFRMPANQGDLEIVERYIEELDNRHIDITSIYNDWVNVGFALSNLGEAGREFYHRVSNKHPEYNPKVTDEKFTSFLSSNGAGINLGTFFHKCKEHGINLHNDNAVTLKNTSDTKGHKNLTEEEIYLKLRDESRVELTEDIPELHKCFFIECYQRQSIIGTFGNFSVINGKAKSRKTFVSSAFAAAAVSCNSILKITSCFPPDKSKVVLADTEQGRSHVQKCQDRILRLSGLTKEEFKSKVEVLALRKYSPKERLKIIEYTLKDYSGLGLLIIDGIRDLINDINNPEEATMITSKLMKWSEEYQIHIIVILHQNKGDNNSRGHLGTEINNKAESVISVTKDSKNKEISVIESEYMRDQDFEPIPFSIDESGLPYLLDNSGKLNPDNKKFDPLTIPLEAHRQILDKVFEINNSLMYEPLWRGIKVAFATFSSKISDNVAKNVKVYYESQKYIFQNNDKTYSYNRFKIPV